MNPKQITSWLAVTAMVLAAGGVTTSFAADKSAGEYAPDNSGRNVRDAKGGTVTPDDQLENKADRTLTQQLRRSLMDDKSLSMTAHNIKIVSINGQVTLRGPVKNESERQTIVEKARQIAGLENVTNQLEVIQN